MRILLADDEPTTRLILQQFLSDYGDCEVVIYGTQAIESFCSRFSRNARFDLICLDINMPGATGSQVLSTIRRVEESHGVIGRDGVKVIMVTGLDDAKVIFESFRDGCEAYLKKPLNLKNFRGLLGELHIPTRKGQTASAQEKKLMSNKLTKKS